MNKKENIGIISDFCYNSFCDGCCLSALCEKYNGIWGKAKEEDLLTAIYLIKNDQQQTRAGKIESHKSKWIKIDENNIPENNTSVLLKCKYMDYTYVTVGSMINGNRGSCQVDPDLFNRSDILAWCPLPED